MSAIIEHRVEDGNTFSFTYTSAGTETSPLTIQKHINRAFPADTFFPANWAPDAIPLIPSMKIVGRPPVRFKDLKSRDCPYTPNPAWEAEWKKQD